LSFFEWDGITSAEWAGTSNYRSLVSDSEVRAAFLHSLILTVFTAFLPVCVGLLLAATLSRAPVRGHAFFRALLFLPVVLPAVAVGVIWRWIYHPTDGPLNAALDAVGLGVLRRSWLGDFTWSLPAVGIMGTWVASGLAMALFLSGVQKIPPSLYDAARVDGAGAVREFFAVTLPGLRNEIVVVLTLSMIFAFRVFDIIFVTTKGGPGDSTIVPALLVYNRAFIYGTVGAASALAVVLAVVIFAVSLAIVRIAER
jgi:raffinose/stachyose/melibiose transport system permease protein